VRAVTATRITCTRAISEKTSTSTEKHKFIAEYSLGDPVKSYEQGFLHLARESISNKDRRQWASEDAYKRDAK
jgi:hypothetical protein